MARNVPASPARLDVPTRSLVMPGFAAADVAGDVDAGAEAAAADAAALGFADAAADAAEVLGAAATLGLAGAAEAGAALLGGALGGAEAPQPARAAAATMEVSAWCNRLTSSAPRSELFG